MTVTIRAFRPDDQEAARILILAGLGEHFGFIDESMNPDLDDIQRSYKANGAVFVVAEARGGIVGTGALIEKAPETGRLVRMSVSPHHRGKGIGRALVGRLLSEAPREGIYQLSARPTMTGTMRSLSTAPAVFAKPGSGTATGTFQRQ